MQTDDTHQDWTQGIDVGRIQIIPDLTIAIDGSATVDLHIIASQLEERSRILENLFKGMGLPVCGIIRELNVALYICGRS